MSTGYRITVFLCPSFYPLLCEAGLESCAGFLVGKGQGLPTGKVDLGLGPARVMSRGVCGLRKSLDSLSADEGTVSPPSEVFGLRCPSIGAYRLLGGASSWC